MAMLVNDLPKLSGRSWIDCESFGRITYTTDVDTVDRGVVVRHSTITIRGADRYLKTSVDCRIDAIQRIQLQAAAGKRTDVAQVRIRKCFIKKIEESSSELQLLTLADLEILEERNVPVIGRGSPQVERRLSRPIGAEGWHCKHSRINISPIDVRIACDAIAQHYWRYSRRTQSVTAGNGIVPEPREQDSVPGRRARKFNVHGPPTLVGCNSGHLPAIQQTTGELIGK